MGKKVNNKFKVFCVSNRIKQKDLSQKADVGITALHYLQNEGKASFKTLEKITKSLNEDFKVKITLEELREMISN